MKSIKNIIFYFMIIGIIIFASTFVLAENYSVGDKFKEKGISEDNNIYVIDLEKADVTGDSLKDRVILVGNKIHGSEDIFADDLKIVVEDGKSDNYYQASYESFAGYEAKLFLGDFTGDKVKDVMVNAPTGGSGGIVNHLIASFKDGNSRILFSAKDNKGVEVAGEFLDNYKVKLSVLNLPGDKKEIIIDQSEKKELYIKQNIYNSQGELIKKIKPYSYPFSSLEAVDYNLDGVFELRGDQRVVGAYGADGVAFVHSLWKYQDSDWNLKQLYFYKLLDYVNVNNSLEKDKTDSNDEFKEESGVMINDRKVNL